MNKFLTNIVLTALLLIPASSNAQLAQSSDGGPFEDLLVNIITFINEIVIPFIIGIGFLFFVWGIFLYFIMGGADEEKRVKGRSLMIWATVGFVSIIIFFGVINLLSSSIGLEGETLKNIPVVPEP